MNIIKRNKNIFTFSYLYGKLEGMGEVPKLSKLVQKLAHSSTY